MPSNCPLAKLKKLNALVAFSYFRIACHSVAPHRHLFFDRYTRFELRRWERTGRPVPVPYLVKKDVILRHARPFGIRTFVETGTHLGDMIHTLRGDFDRLYSIELHGKLFRWATKRFQDDPRIKIVHGDSGEKLREILAEIHEPALFYLDGHYSGGTVSAKGPDYSPVLKELGCIFAHTLGPRHVVVVDDARLFGVEEGYPGLGEVEDLTRQRRPEMTMKVESDLLQIYPPLS
jgi:hypothetical protein